MTDPTERTRASLELLYSISRELAAQLELPPLLEKMLRLTIESTGAASGSILVLDTEGRPAEGAFAYGGRVEQHTAEQLAITLDRGLAGWVVRNQEPALIANTIEDQRWMQRAEGAYDQAPRSAISVPLITHQRVVGVLTLVQPEAGRMSQEDLALLTSIAEQAAVAVENARLFAAEQKRRRFASTLAEIAHIISSTLDPGQVFPRVLEQLARVVDYDSATIILFEDGRLKIAAARGFPDDQALVGVSLPTDPSSPGMRLIASRSPLVIDDVQLDEGWLKTASLQSSRMIRGWMGAPMLVQNDAVGIISVDSQKLAAYSAQQAQELTAFADQAATAVANAQLFKRNQQQLMATKALAEAARVVSASLDLGDVLQRILAQTLLAVQVEAASLALVDKRSGELEFKFVLGRGDNSIVGSRLKPGEGVAGWVAVNAQVAVVDDVTRDPRFSPRIDRQTGTLTRALACAPIMLHDEVIGVLEAINPTSAGFSEQQVELLVGIAGLAGTAISHAQLFDSTQVARSRYRGLFEGSANPILITDLAGRVTDANHSAEVLLGIGRDELLGSSMLSLLDQDPERLPATLFNLGKDQSLTYESQASAAEGQKIPVEIHVKRLDLAQQPIQQWILRDISERKQLDELREDLTSMIFHDLRSPLGNVIASLEMLSALMDSEDESLHSMLSIAMRSSRRVNRLVESLLDVGRLESGKAVLKKTPASLAELINEALVDISPVAEAKSMTIQTQIARGLPEVVVDVDMVRRVLINLIENAVKYTPAEGKIVVRVKRQQEAVVISIEDNGPGITPENQEKLFLKFSRIHHEGRPKGLGLGLAFCRLAVEKHGGKIWVTSEPGSGSTFSFKLPVSDHQEA